MLIETSTVPPSAPKKEEALRADTRSSTVGVSSWVGDARVSVVMPTLNEAANLSHVFARMPSEVHEIIVVDGHSIDDTVLVAEELGRSGPIPVKLVMQDRKGKGDALRCGFDAASGDIIVMLDADGSTDPAEIPAFVEALRQGADFAKGSRFAAGAGSSDITPLRRLGNRGLSGFVNVLFGTRYTDLCYGYNAFWTRCLPHMDVTCDGFEVETLINVRVAKAGLTISEVPSFEHERRYGESKLSAWRDGRRILRTILRERLPTGGMA
jgi:glycosyltransferase involved in cell wall biosynthesis